MTLLANSDSGIASLHPAAQIIAIIAIAAVIISFFYFMHKESR